MTFPQTLMGFPVVIDSKCKTKDGDPGWRLELGDLSRYIYVYLCDTHFAMLGDFPEYTICTGLIAHEKCSVKGCTERAQHMCSVADFKE